MKPRCTVAGLAAELARHTDNPATGVCRQCGRRYCGPYAEARARLVALNVDVAALLARIERRRRVPWWAEWGTSLSMGALLVVLLSAALLPAGHGPAGAPRWTFAPAAVDVSVSGGWPGEALVGDTAVGAALLVIAVVGLAAWVAAAHLVARLVAWRRRRPAR